MEVRAGDAVLTLPGALILAALIALGESAWLQELPAAISIAVKLPRLLLGLAYVLFVPGYWLTAALFPGKEDLDGIERTGLSLGLSVAWVSVLALILDRLPWGLRLWPIFAREMASIVIFAIVSLWRQSRLPVDAAYVPPMDWRPRPWWRSLPVLEKRIYLLCAGALLVAGLAAAWIFLVPSPDEFMTEFYILGEEGTAEAYPREAAPGEELRVTMGIHNLEREAQTYRLEVWAVDPWEDRREQVQSAGPFTLAREEQVEQQIAWAMPWAGDDQMVDFYLYTGDAEGDQPYRQLRLWLNVEE
jgi:uncharacterized membrane protein